MKFKNFSLQKFLYVLHLTKTSALVDGNTYGILPIVHMLQKCETMNPESNNKNAAFFNHRIASSELHIPW